MAVRSRLLLLATVIGALAVLAACASTATPQHVSHPPARADAVATTPVTSALPADWLIPTDCPAAARGLPRGPLNAAHLPPSPGQALITKSQAICIAENASLDAIRDHPAWAWLTTRAKTASYGWSGCTCDNPNRPVWVVSVDGPQRTDGSPSTPPKRVTGYGDIIDAATGQGTDAVIGGVWLPGGHEATLPAG